MKRLSRGFEAGGRITCPSAGEADWGPSVFFELGDLEPGDRVMVTRADGMIAEFEVEAVRRYPKDEFPTQLVYGDIDHAGLRLITCGGPFDRELRHYLDNVVVFGSLVDS